MNDTAREQVGQIAFIPKRFALMRALIISLVALLCVALSVKSGASTDPSTVGLYAVLFIAFIESFIIVVIMRRGYQPGTRLPFLLLSADLLLTSGIVILTGGSESPFNFLYIAVILSASILLSFKESLLFGAICSAFFLLAVFLERGLSIVPAFPFRWQKAAMPPDELSAYLGMNVFAFFLTVILAGYLSRQVGLLQMFQRNILNSLSSGFIGIDRNCMVTLLNPAGAGLLRRHISEGLGKHVSEVFATPPGQPNPIEESVAEQRECRSKEVTVTRGDGKRIPVGITVSLLRDNSRKITGAVASFTDLTELKRMEEDLRRADRLAAIGEMSAVLAHEIRNPAASIRGAIQELAENVKLDGTDAQLMKIAIREADQLERIVSDFLGFVRPNPRGKEQFDVNQFLEEVVQVAERCLIPGSKVSILKEWPESLGNIMADRGQIRQAVLNVIQNGVEAMPEGGALRIRAGDDGESAGYIGIFVEDEGNGVSPEEACKLFDPFYTTKPHGIGLGMSIVHRIITSHGGSIDFESSSGKGTTVRMMLPRESRV
ncbi:MAG: PAS domain-containing protein [Candidatus Lindowbacteria bacterium]|nr:PAS domain-containing protein [Candidatus Lindowbacteria bacterium]